MKAVQIIALACVLAIANGQTLAVTSTDQSLTSVYPLNIYATSAPTTIVEGFSSSSATGSPAPTLSGTAATYTANYVKTAGIPLQQSWVLTQASSSPAIIGFTVALTIGTQVSVTVTGTAGASGNTDSAGAAVASQSAVLGTSTNCGNYYLDCLNGVLYFQMHVPAVASTTCTVAIQQTNAVYAGLGYASAPSAAAITQLQSAITSQSGITGPTATYCGQGTSGSNVVLYFLQQYTTQPSSASQSTTDATKLAAAIKAKNSAFTVSARLLEENDRVLATTYTILGGYASALPPSTTGGSGAPNANAATAITNNGGLNSSNAARLSLGLVLGVATIFGLVL